MEILRWIKKNLIISIAISIFLAVVLGTYFDLSWMKSLVLPLTFLLVYPMMVTLQFHTLIEKGNWKLQVTTQLINFIVYPTIAYVLGILFFEDQAYFRLGLLLITLLPTSGMTISWTVMAKGNVHEAIRMIVIGLLLGAVLSPLYISLLLGTAIQVSFWTIFTHIMLVVFIPLFTAYITQRIIIYKAGSDTFHTKIKPIFPLFSTLGVVLMIFVAIAVKANVIVQNPGILLQILPVLIILYALFLLISVLVGRFLFKREDAIALVNGTVIRNLSLSLAITLSAFEGAGIAALLIAIAFALQVQIAAWTVKLSQLIFR
ncbi:arsenic resistance protein [Candidatus Xianfuyuplasma coldseepsis]|uniref:Arsenic resistance protein n=1 Tax=Candidatus Xianfuyuplasma coldseepsis TaxID=2782163 RepID=A0A7L7KS06_9MOLU|nr:bile acid:sodium symporter [Xianfuyuplasma coldseepsis]QMS85513.1 arsenic resistance protein [Xianfuyuplasma coldseepsis]